MNTWKHQKRKEGRRRREKSDRYARNDRYFWELGLKLNNGLQEDTYIGKLVIMSAQPMTLEANE